MLLLWEWNGDDEQLPDEKSGRTLVSAVDECRADPMPDFKIVGTRDAMHVCNETAESSDKLTQYLLNLADREHLGDNDRSIHDFDLLTQFF